MQLNQPCVDGIYVIDTVQQRPQMTAAYLIVSEGCAAFFDAGVNHSVPHLLHALNQQGLSVQDVKYLILSHVHLDHAGGAGRLLEQLPHAQVIVHTRGLRHMLDPTQLQAGVESVYGSEAAQRMYGKLLPIASSRIRATVDNEIIHLGKKTLHILETPGHCKHHISVMDHSTQAVLCGDIFGIAYLERYECNMPLIFPTTSPVQFEPASMRASIARIVSLNPQYALLTHYGCIDQPARHAQTLYRLIDAYVAAYTKRGADLVGLKHDLFALLRHEAQRIGCTMNDEQLYAHLATDIHLNAQGLQYTR